jgi:hypothetical protein
MEAATTATAAEAPPAPAEASSDAPAASQDAEAQPPEAVAEANGGERDDSGKFLSREAASYRRRLRDTEAERDQLRTQLDRLQSAEVERLAGDAGLQVPATCGRSVPRSTRCAARTAASTPRP